MKIELKDLKNKDTLRTCGTRGSGRAKTAGNWLHTSRQVAPSIPIDGVVVFGDKRLQQTTTSDIRQRIRVKTQRGLVLASDQGHNKQDKEKNEHREVEDGKADNSSLPELRLLQGVDRRTDLTTIKQVRYRSDWRKARIETYLGRNQNKQTEWNLSTKGMQRAGNMRKRRR